MQNFWYSPAYVIHMQAELTKIYNECLANPTIEVLKKIWDLDNK